jgi:hypothetical protein
VTVPPDDDLAVLAEVQGVLIEVLEARNSELSAQVAGLEERLARLERLVSRNSLLTELSCLFPQFRGHVYCDRQYGHRS